MKSHERAPRSSSKTLFTVAATLYLALGSALASPAVARADDGAPEFVYTKKERSIGFGTAFGGGFAGMKNSFSGALLLPTAELQIFLPREYSIDLSVPVLNMVLGSALVGGTIIGGDLFYNVNAGNGRTRFVGGPGVGFAYANVNHTTVTSLKLPAQIGFEVLSKKRTFGFKMVARPWLEIANGSSSSTSGVGGGLLGALVVSGYALSEREQE